MKKKIIFHPFLFAFYPVLFLYSYNIYDTPIKQIFLPLLIIIISITIIFFLLFYVLKNTEKAGLITSLFLFIFFSFRSIHTFIYSAGLIFFESKYLLIIDIIFFFLIAYFIIKTGKELEKVTEILNVTGGVLILLSIFSLSGSLIEINAYQAGFEERKEEEIIETQKNSYRPNIYYIIFDACGREDVLREVYEYDNSEFLSFLKEKGFYIGDKSYSNYCQTCLSIPSSINMEYLHDLFKEVKQVKGDMSTNSLIKHGKVIRFLKNYGYTFVAFSTGYNLTEADNADIYISASIINEFVTVLIEMTPLPEILTFTGLITPYDLYRQNLLYNLDHIGDVCKIPSPVFVFLHIQGVHPPFIFGANGEEIPYKREEDFSLGYIYKENEYKSKYTNQLIFINKKLEEAIDKLIEESKEPPVIILQADHGPNLSGMENLNDMNRVNFKERMSILYACYLPDGNKDIFYEGITPVNTFRIIFNHYFHTKFPVMEDRMFFSTQKEPYNFIEITEKLKVSQPEDRKK